MQADLVGRAETWVVLDAWPVLAAQFSGYSYTDTQYTIYGRVLPVSEALVYDVDRSRLARTNQMWLERHESAVAAGRVVTWPTGRTGHGSTIGRGSAKVLAGPGGSAAYDLNSEGECFAARLRSVNATPEPNLSDRDQVAGRHDVQDVTFVVPTVGCCDALLSCSGEHGPALTARLVPALDSPAS